MPAKSKAQARLMDAVSHNPTFARKVGIPQSVGAEYGVAKEGYKGLPETVKRPQRGKTRNRP